LAEFFDDGQEVVKRVDGIQRLGIRWPVDPAEGGEQEGGLDDGEGDAALVELSCEESILVACACGSVRQTQVGLDDAAGVVLGRVCTGR
jgi:hypothetical protein